MLDAAYVLAVASTLHCLVLREHKLSVNSNCSLKTAQKKVKLTNLSMKVEKFLTSTLGLGKGEAKLLIATSLGFLAAKQIGNRNKSS